MTDGRPTPGGRPRPTPAGRPTPLTKPVARTRPTPAGRGAPTRPPSRARRVGLFAAAPFLFAVAAILLLTTAAVTYVLNPHWGGAENYVAAPRNVGQVPTESGALVRYVSPDRIEIPAIDAVAPIVKVGLLPGRELDIPLNPKVVGWWSSGAKPGARTGTAILAGHINYAGVQGTMAKIGTLDPGDRVTVYGKRKGKEIGLAFRVTGVRTYKKTALPYASIFDQHSVGRIAIVTCGGAFDASTGNYEDNIVVFAVPSHVPSNAA